MNTYSGNRLVSIREEFCDVEAESEEDFIAMIENGDVDPYYSEHEDIGDVEDIVCVKGTTEYVVRVSITVKAVDEEQAESVVRKKLNECDGYHTVEDFEWYCSQIDMVEEL